jgi:DNA-binding MarR family transcriptional regulator
LNPTSRTAARKFWEVVPRVMSTVAAEARRGGNNLAPSHFRTLKMLSLKRFNLSELAEHQDVSLPSMSASVETLVQRGWLERKRSDEDRRITELLVTEKGNRILAEEAERMLGWTAKRLNQLSPEQLERVELGLDTLRTVFDEFPTHGRKELMLQLHQKMGSGMKKKIAKKINKKITKLNSRSLI